MDILIYNTVINFQDYIELLIIGIHRTIGTTLLDSEKISSKPFCRVKCYCNICMLDLQNKYEMPHETIVRNNIFSFLC